MTGNYRAEYDKHGWCLSRHFFGAGEVAEIAGWCDEVLDPGSRLGSRMVYGEGSLRDANVTMIRRIERFCDDHAPFNSLLRSGRHVPVVSKLLGGDACLFKEKINVKQSGGSGYEIHQDQQAGWTAFAPVFATAMICIDAINPSNGGFQIASSARCDQLVAGEWADLDEEQASHFDLKQLALEPGDLLMFDSFVPHGSGPSFASDARRAVFATYNLLSLGDHRRSYFDLKEASARPLAAWPAGAD